MTISNKVLSTRRLADPGPSAAGSRTAPAAPPPAHIHTPPRPRRPCADRWAPETQKRQGACRRPSRGAERRLPGGSPPRPASSHAADPGPGPARPALTLQAAGGKPQNPQQYLPPAQEPHGAGRPAAGGRDHHPRWKATGARRRESRSRHEGGWGRRVGSARAAILSSGSRYRRHLGIGQTAFLPSSKRPGLEAFSEAKLQTLQLFSRSADLQVGTKALAEACAPPFLLAQVNTWLLAALPGEFPPCPSKDGKTQKLPSGVPWRTEPLEADLRIPCFT
jgi:hypothetical protein